MIGRVQKFIFLTIAVFGTMLLHVGGTYAAESKIGIVIVHGKGGSPTRHVSELASSLEAKGYLVANLEMPWSGRRHYDVSVSAAEKEIESALATLRNKGAQKLFVAGHSQGGLFALYFGGRHQVDGIIAIAPGGDVSNRTFRQELDESVRQARKLVAEGKGNDKTEFYDYEGRKGVTAVISTPAIYLSWFDPDGAMNQTMAMKNMNPRVPVLYIGPTEDYPYLRRIKHSMYGALPDNPLSKMYEPDSTHLGAPSASRDEIVRWTAEVRDKANPALQGTPGNGRP